MKKNETLKSLILIFVITLQVSIILWLFSVPNFTYISLNKVKNYYNNTSADVYRNFPDIRIYDDKKSSDLSKVLKNNEKSFVIIDDCPCKRELIDKYLAISKKDDIPITYIYLKPQAYKKDEYAKKYKNVSIYKASRYDIFSSFKKEEYTSFPIVYIIDNEGMIIAKDI